MWKGRLEGLVLAFCTLWFSFGVSTSVLAQRARIIFTDTVFDFHRIREDGGLAEHSFAFVNAGDAPLLLHSVGTSCGCTVSEWPRDPVMPGENGHVKAVFNPNGRPHGFTKTLTVRSNGVQEVVTLRIEGYVIPKRQAPAQRFMVRVGSLGLERSFIPVGRVLDRGEAFTNVVVYNFDKTPQTVKFSEVGKGVHLSPKEATVAPEDSVLIAVRLDGGKLEDWGFGQVRVKILNVNQEGWVTFAYSREEDFSSLSSEALAKAPRAQVGESKFNFKAVQEGDVVEHTFELSNSGGQPLEIRGLSAPCQCITVKASGHRVKPGGQVTISVKFDTKGYVGNQFKQVVLITNDPTQPQQLLEVFGQVVRN